MKKRFTALFAAGLILFAASFALTDMLPQAATANAATASNHSLVSLRDGSTSSIAELSQDKPLFLNFWASWCPPCVGEMPAIHTMYLRYGDRVNFAAVSIDSSADDANAYITGKGADLEIPFYYGNIDDIANAYRLDAIPQSFLIAPGGEIIAHHVGAMNEDALAAFIESAL